jgi:hypothetical protein
MSDQGITDPIEAEAIRRWERVRELMGWDEGFMTWRDLDDVGKKIYRHEAREMFEATATTERS